MDKLYSLYCTVLNLVADVPFGNSDTQNRVSVVDEEKTPHRALRHAALRIMNRMEALRDARYNLQRQAIEIKILEREKAESKDTLRQEMIDLEIEHKKSHAPYTKKLIADAVREIESLWPVVAAMGKVSREEFEKGELDWYKQKHGVQVSLDKDLYAKIQDLPNLGLVLPDLKKELLDAPS